MRDIFARKCEVEVFVGGELGSHFAIECLSKRLVVVDEALDVEFGFIYMALDWSSPKVLYEIGNSSDRTNKR